MRAEGDGRYVGWIVRMAGERKDTEEDKAVRADANRNMQERTVDIRNVSQDNDSGRSRLKSTYMWVPLRSTDKVFAA